MLSGSKQVSLASLGEKMDEYLLRLGYSNADAEAIMVELMTKGKVKVDFRDSTERIELVRPDDKLTPSQAITLFDSYVKDLNTPRKKEEESSTRVFRIQPPPLRPGK